MLIVQGHWIPRTRKTTISAIHKKIVNNWLLPLVEMADFPLMVTQDLQELESSLEPYDDDFSEEAVLITSFEASPGTVGELAGGRSNDESTDPNSTCAQEGETYANMISHTRVRAALKRPIRLCKFYGVPACLMVLEIEFLETKYTRQMPRLLRFKAVDVTVEFKDAAGSSKLGPEIVKFCPQNYAGEPTVVNHSYSATAGASIEVSAGIPFGPSVGMHITHAEQFAKSSTCSITGRTLLMGDKARIVKWQLQEDEALQRGVPNQLKFVMAVNNPDERAFNVKLNFSAYLGFNDIEFRVKKKQNVLSTKVDPKMLRERAMNDEHGPAFGKIWQCLADDADLASIKLEELTNLKGSTVGRTYTFD